MMTFTLISCCISSVQFLLLATVSSTAAFIITTTPSATGSTSFQRPNDHGTRDGHRTLLFQMQAVRTPLDGEVSTTSESSSSASSSSSSSSSRRETPSEVYDVVVVGSGIGGLSCAAMLAQYGYSVAVFEKHSTPGGAAHGFRIRYRNNQDDDGTAGSGGDFIFDTGPSFFSGLTGDGSRTTTTSSNRNGSSPTNDDNNNRKKKGSSTNPLKTVLDAVNETVDCIPYTTFGLVLPEGNFLHTSGFGNIGGIVDQVEGSRGLMAWKRLMHNMEPLAKAVEALPTAALRTDVGVALTVAPYLSNFASLNPLDNLKLTKPFQTILDNSGIERGSFTRKWLDLLCFCLSGLTSDGTITAEMAMMMGEFYDDQATMDCPVGGSKAIVDALVRGIEKYGGKVFVNMEVEKIVVENAVASGVRLANNKKNNSKRLIRVKDAVVSNLSVWDLYGSGIVDKKAFPDSLVKERMDTPVGKSFMHLHVGFRATRDELNALQAHYMYIDSWDKGIEAEENAVLLSIPSVHDDTLAPDGYGVLHIYTPATEEYGRWEGLDRKSDEYRALKEERSQYLWKVLTKIIPDIKERTVISKVGTPLTHQRFLNRYMGSYGPAIRAGEASFPFPGTPIKKLLVCGDSCFPGIGVPAVAGSGILAANSVSLDSVIPQMKLLKELRRKQES